MSLTKQEERWLACLDRAIVLAQANPEMSPGQIADLTDTFYYGMGDVCSPSPRRLVPKPDDWVTVKDAP